MSANSGSWSKFLYLYLDLFGAAGFEAIFISEWINDSWAPLTNIN